MCARSFCRLFPLSLLIRSLIVWCSWLFSCIHSSTCAVENDSSQKEPAQLYDERQKEEQISTICTHLNHYGQHKHTHARRAHFCRYQDGAKYRFRIYQKQINSLRYSYHIHITRKHPHCMPDVHIVDVYVQSPNKPTMLADLTHKPSGRNELNREYVDEDRTNSNSNNTLKWNETLHCTQKARQS